MQIKQRSVRTKYLRKSKEPYNKPEYISKPVLPTIGTKAELKTIDQDLLIAGDGRFFKQGNCANFS
jgi:hypothetical protein